MPAVSISSPGCVLPGDQALVRSPRSVREEFFKGVPAVSPSWVNSHHLVCCFGSRLSRYRGASHMVSSSWGALPGRSRGQNQGSSLVQLQMPALSHTSSHTIPPHYAVLVGDCLGTTQG